MHIDFLKDVLIYTLTAFGGPSGHFGMMMKTFVQKRKDVTEEDLLDIVSFCQLLPGASSTQTITVIGYRKGGLGLALLTLLVWILPACVLMILLSIFLNSLGEKTAGAHYLRFIQPMAIGFLAYASFRAYKISIHSKVTGFIMITAATIVLMLFKSPWVFPLVIVLSGVVTNFTEKKKLPAIPGMPHKIKWGNILIFFSIFLLAGLLSETARKQQWKERKAYNLFENFYRFGSFVFGGGDVLIPMIYEQYVVRPRAPRVIRNNPDAIKIDGDEFLAGAGMVRAIPGPVFSITAFTGARVYKNEPIKKQWIGGMIGAISIFLPSALLVLFFYPVWNNLKKYPVFYRALDGINAAVVGVLIASTGYLLKDVLLLQSGPDIIMDILVVFGTFLLLNFSSIRSPFIVIICVVLGIARSYL